ncbi:hypothetical protein SEA_BRYNNIE_44 [Arthrobacter phage Brynnie]|nr:hypothetical protein SEA_BRYNNIE_44 [Arthrobacter phage Brynnie]URM87012.1 hypothetical protein SEA_BASILISK_45 [Arthrobacter phage Basilisk]WNM69492.1 hypothetical protein SEA_RUCHI_44 [Arthrobacter phage Ruchi]
MSGMTQEQAVAVVAYLNRAGLVIAMEGQAAVWRDALYGVRYADAVDACRELVREGAVRERFATPADVLRMVRRMRGKRLADAVPPAPPVALDVAADLAFRRAWLRAVGDGATEEQADAHACGVVGVVRAVESGPSRDPRELIEQTAAALSSPEK